MDFAYRDRAKYLGDPDFFFVPQELLTSKKYANDIFQLIKKKKLLMNFYIVDLFQKKNYKQA